MPCWSLETPESVGAGLTRGESGLGQGLAARGCGAKARDAHHRDPGHCGVGPALPAFHHISQPPGCSAAVDRGVGRIAIGLACGAAASVVPLDRRPAGQQGPGGAAASRPGGAARRPGGGRQDARSHAPAAMPLSPEPDGSRVPSMANSLFIHPISEIFPSCRVKQGKLASPQKEASRAPAPSPPSPQPPAPGPPPGLTRTASGTTSGTATTPLLCVKANAV